MRIFWFLKTTIRVEKSRAFIMPQRFLTDKNKDGELTKTEVYPLAK